MLPIVFYLNNPSKLLLSILRHISFLFSDKQYLKLFYRIKTGKRLNLKDPKTFTEKLQFLKLYNRKPEYTIMVDKIKVKDYVANLIGEKYIIPTYGIWNKPEDIDIDKLPEKFVLKCNHNSGTIIVCKDKSLFDLEYSIKILSKGLNDNYYLQGREWPYKNVDRKIFAEQYMQDENDDYLTDYKYFCFNGEPYMMYVSKDRSHNATTDFFDMNYNLLDLRMKDPNSECPPQKPVHFEEMKELARKLSKGHPHIRVDFYVINNQIYFGELTFFHNSGFGPITPLEWDYKLGSMIDLNHIKLND